MASLEERDGSRSRAVLRAPRSTSMPGSSSTPATAGRISGIDLARSLAIFGMFAVHVGPTDADGWLGRLYAVPHGRASLLFVLVAGAGLSLLSASPGTSTLRTVGSLGWRAALLLPLGLALQELDHGVAVILQDYAVLFVVGIVALVLTDRWLLAFAGIALPLGSVGFLWGQLSAPEVFDRGAVALSQPVGEIVHGLVLSGPYPLITWIPPFLFGMWLGRRDLRSSLVRRRLLVVGTLVVVVASSLSRLLREVLDADGAPIGWEHLAVDTAHSQMPLWLIGSTAAAVVVLAASLHLADAVPGLARPLVYTGQLSLTVYVGHLLALHAAPALLTSGVVPSAAAILGSFVLVSMACSYLWRSWFSRGPLEFVLHLPWSWR